VGLGHEDLDLARFRRGRGRRGFSSGFEAFTVGAGFATGGSFGFSCGSAVSFLGFPFSGLSFFQNRRGICRGNRMAVIRVVLLRTAIQTDGASTPISSRVAVPPGSHDVGARILSSQPLREGWPPISEEEVELPSGARKRWIRMHFGTSAAVLAVTPQKQIVLTREYRHGLGRIVHSLPGGTARNGESLRRVRGVNSSKKTGFQGPKFLEMYAGNNLTAYLEGTLHLFFAKECHPQNGDRTPTRFNRSSGFSVTSALSSARGENSNLQS